MKSILNLYYRFRYRRERRFGDNSNMLVAQIAMCMSFGAAAPEGNLIETLVSDMHRHYDMAEEWKRKIDALDAPGKGQNGYAALGIIEPVIRKGNDTK